MNPASAMRWPGWPAVRRRREGHCIRDPSPSRHPRDVRWYCRWLLADALGLLAMTLPVGEGEGTVVRAADLVAMRAKYRPPTSAIWPLDPDFIPFFAPDVQTRLRAGGAATEDEIEVARRHPDFAAAADAKLKRLQEAT